MNVFITGISSGIGKELSLKFANEGHQVFGISRRELDYKHGNISHQACDIQKVNSDNFTLLKDVNELDLVILNAGVLGEIKELQDATLEELQKTMDINLWAQKQIIDSVLKNNNAKKIWAISSGAAIKGSKGWSGYSISKAAFKMLIELYASEIETTQFLSIAPGLVNTAMQDHLCDQDKVDKNKFSNMQRLVEARESGSMVTPKELADKFYGLLETLSKLDTGSYTDLRNS